jgi:2-oxo-4-hydroxy-4-carboxy-5-ureidoimidazoline decarboxylase
MSTHGSLGLDGFNALSDGQGTDLLLEVCSSGVWASRLLAARPYRDVEGLLDRAARVLAELPDAEVDAALDGHPPIGGRSDDASAAPEQAGMATAGADVRAELTRMNRAYQDKFGYLYLVSASGRSASELLHILTERLDNDPETERAVMRSELMQINRLRLKRLLAPQHIGNPS